MQKDWQAPRVGVQRSKFNRSHGHKTTFDADLLIPVCCEEVLPGDTVNMSLSAFCRMATPIYPLMDNQRITVHWFFTPLRLLWENAENFFGEDLVGADGNAPVKPLRTTNATVGAVENQIEDYFGIPTLVPNLTYDELPIRGYFEIFNEWYRDQNLQEKFPIEKGDLPNDWSNVDPTQPGQIPLLKRNKAHDYFTSSLPWPQKSLNDISIPVVQPGLDISEMNPFIWQSDADGISSPLEMKHTGDSLQNVNVRPNTPPATETGSIYLDPEGFNANAGTINQLRISFAIQKYFERSARGGSRYPEVLAAHFAVTSPDARLQRPEYLGRNVATVNVTPIAQTFENTAEPTDRTLGDLGAMGTISMNNQFSFVKSFVEHGYIYGIASVTADLTYQQGLHRMWRRDNRFEYYWPEFAGLGEQAVATQEIYAGDLTGPVGLEDTWGFQERYAEYRFSPSRISGQFRSYITTPLDAWHLSQEFTEKPVLNENFIASSTPMDRVLAVPTEPHFIADFYFHTTWVRPMPLFGIPGNVDRF